MGDHPTTLIGEIFLFLSQLIGFITVIYKNKHDNKQVKEEIKTKVDTSFERHEKNVDKRLQENKEIAMQAAKAAQTYNQKIDKLAGMFDTLRKKEAELQQREMGQAIADAAELAKQKTVLEDSGTNKDEALRHHNERGREGPQ